MFWNSPTKQVKWYSISSGSYFAYKNVYIRVNRIVLSRNYVDDHCVCCKELRKCYTPRWIVTIYFKVDFGRTKPTRPILSVLGIGLHERCPYIFSSYITEKILRIPRLRLFYLVLFHFFLVSFLVVFVLFHYYFCCCFL